MNTVRSSALVAALLLAACGSTLSGASPSPAVSAAPSSAAPPSASPAPTGPLPRSAVHVTVNGAPYDMDKQYQLTPTGQPVVIEMTFPFAVDRPFLETWLPRTAATVWIDDRTVRLTFPETESNIGFKIPETRAADRTATIDLFIVNVAFPATRVVSFYTIAELTAGTYLPTAATSFRISAPGFVTLSPDGRRGVSFDAVQSRPAGVGPALLDLVTRKSTPLAEPAQADGPFAFADWLPDGRLLIVGRRIWVANGDGTGMRAIAEASAAAGGPPMTAVTDPAGDRVALWADSADGHVAVIDLRTGVSTKIAGPFRRPRDQSRVTLAWSRDGALLAGMDTDPGGGPSAATRVRIVEVAADRTVRTIEGGGVLDVSSFASGELLVVRESGETGAGARNVGAVTGFDGVEHRRFLGLWWWMSPDTRYVVQLEATGGAGYPSYTLIELATGRSYVNTMPTGFTRWMADGRLAFVGH